MSFQNNSIVRIIKNHLNNYPTPIALNYFWNFGSISGFFLLLQIITGLFLAMHYTPAIYAAFDSVEHIMREVNYGWLIRYMHSNGASFFFIAVYIHIGRSLYYRSFNEKLYRVWVSGVFIFLLMMATAFLGYILPWGQMSLWGATVITNLFSTIPFVGKTIVSWLWGGYSVDNPTLIRFFALHFILPFVILLLVVLHLVFLHQARSSHPLKGMESDGIMFFPYFYLKDLFGLICFLTVYFFFVFFHPNALGHPDNYIPANPLVTPAHIVPEWYFLPFYAILRSVPNKTAGVFLMFSAILTLIITPLCLDLLLSKKKMNNLYYNININGVEVPTYFCDLYQFMFWVFVAVVIILGFIGSKPAAEPYIFWSLVGTLYYFFFLTIGQSLAVLGDGWINEHYVKNFITMEESWIYKFLNKFRLVRSLRLKKKQVLIVSEMEKDLWERRLEWRSRVPALREKYHCDPFKRKC